MATKIEMVRLTNDLIRWFYHERGHSIENIATWFDMLPSEVWEVVEYR